LSLPSADSGFSGSPFSPEAFEPSYSVPPQRRKFQSRLWLHALLFVMTLASTTFVGAGQYAAFASDFGRKTVEIDWTLLTGGLWYSIPVLAILGAHEMGHYLYCRRYNIDATLPYFLPLPIIFSGTLGAVIKIREPFPTRKALFDVGIAGPIAGFVVLVPMLFIGVALSTVIPSPPADAVGMQFGEPLLFQWVQHAVHGEFPPGYELNAHPVVWAAWFGMLATALNLLPFGQLDGGHVSYAALGRWSAPISLITVVFTVGMTFVSVSWVFMAAMMLAMLLLLGPGHPRALSEHEPLDSGRKLLALLALVMLVTCFTPVPIELKDLIRNP
jgi:membrane-associated protease RseP (regulator of RpoE activity)